MIDMRLFRKKKGMAFLPGLIGAVLVSLLLIFLMVTIILISRQNVNDGKCAASIFAADTAASVRRGSAETVDFTPAIDCTAHKKEIEVAHVSRSGKNNGRIDDDLVKNMFATEMMDCWGLVGNGKQDPFKQFWSRFSDRTYCMTCAELTFSEEFQESAQEQPYALEDLDYYLATRMILGTDMTFYKFMYGAEPQIEAIADLRNNGDSFPLDKTYHVIWRLDSFEGLGRTIIAVSTGMFIGSRGGPLGVLAGAFIGYTASSAAGSTVHQGVYVMPRELLSSTLTRGEIERDMCTILVN